MKKISIVCMLIVMILTGSIAGAQEKILPDNLYDDLFRPLLADPKWPRFAVDYNHFTVHEELSETVDGTFGRSFPLITGAFKSGMKWEGAIQMGMTAQFDLAAASNDLITTDYIISFNYTVQQRNFALLTRIYHQSSHLGDEYVIRNRDNPNVVRENLSFESVNLVASYDVKEWLRVYGGGEYIPAPDPLDYGKWGYQLGAEVYFKPDLKLMRNIFLALDIKGYKGTDYNPQLSGRIVFHPGGRLYLALKAFHGNSHNGQFFRNTETYYGFAFQFY